MSIVINIKSVYEAPSKNDGIRILVDRIWPRGLTKEKVACVEWAKALAPTTDLRKWFNHQPERWEGFQKKYLAELQHNDAVKAFIAAHQADKVITLIYASRDQEHNQAVVLQTFFEKRLT